MKEQIAPHLEKLEALTANGDERAQEKFIALQIKVKQINAVLPYLEKCIIKNKEAEQKTIAILEKKRDEELAALENGTPSVDSPTEKSDNNRKNSTSDLYMKVLAENDDVGENSQLGDSFSATAETNDAIHYLTPLRERHNDIMNSTPVQQPGVPVNVENAIMNDSIIPITHSLDYQDQETNPLDETIIASASMVQEQAIPVVVEPFNPEVSLQPDVSRIPVVDASPVVPSGSEQSPILNLNPESSVVELRPRAGSNSKPPPIKPKKKKAPPPRPPRRSSSYLSDGTEPQLYSPVSDNRQSLSTVAPAIPQHHSNGYTLVESQGSPVPDARQRHSTDHSSLSPTVSAGPPVAARPPRRSGSHMSDNIELQKSPGLEIQQRRHSVSNSSGGSSPVVSAGPPVASRPPRRSGSHLSDNIELRGSPVRETRQRHNANHGSSSSLSAGSSPVVSTGPPVASKPPRRSGSHLSDNFEPQGSPVLETRQNTDYSTADVTAAIPSHPSGTNSNKTSEYLGEDLVNVSVFSKIKVRRLTVELLKCINNILLCFLVGF